ncbi:MAG: hypothetical protein ACTSRR_09925 [Candidatus Heimdallarchaeaceae archaeon]
MNKKGIFLMALFLLSFLSVMPTKALVVTAMSFQMEKSSTLEMNYGYTSSMM